LREWFSSN